MVNSFLLFTQIYPCTNKLYNYIKITVKYSGNPKIVPYNSFSTRIIVYTDHNNLTFESFTTERVLRCCLMSEEYIPEIK